MNKSFLHIKPAYDDAGTDSRYNRSISTSRFRETDYTELEETTMNYVSGLGVRKEMMAPTL